LGFASRSLAFSAGVNAAEEEASFSAAAAGFLGASFLTLGALATAVGSGASSARREKRFWVGFPAILAVAIFQR